MVKRGRRDGSSSDAELASMLGDDAPDDVGLYESMLGDDGEDSRGHGGSPASALDFQDGRDAGVLPGLDGLDAEGDDGLSVDDVHDMLFGGEAEAVVDPSAGDVEQVEHSVLQFDSNNMLCGPDDSGPIERFALDDALGDSVRLGASDVHVYPEQYVEFRVNGVLYKTPKYGLVTRDDIEPSLVDESARVIDNRTQGIFNATRDADSSYVIKGGEYSGARFRAKFGESIKGRYMVFRRINDTIYTPDAIGLDANIVEWGMMQQGLILVTGPTGSGKSSTLATILREAQLKRADKFVTIEEPVEYVYPNDGLGLMEQREVPRDSRTFLAGVTAAMREDPDVILIGEARDDKTIEAALQASNTGHLTFTTVHANNSADTIARVLNMFSSEDVSRFKFDLASNLKAVLSQRLVLTADKHSRVAIREVMLVGAAERKCIMNFDIEGLSAMMMEQHKDMDWILGVQAGNGVLDMDSALATAADQPRFFEGYKSVSSL